MKKFGYMFIGAIFTLILSIGFLSFADDSTGKNASDNDLFDHSLKPQDNSKIEEERIYVEETPILATVEQPKTRLASKKEDSPGVVKEEQLLAEEEVFLDKLKQLEIKIKSDQTEIKLKQEREKKKVISEVEIEWKNEEIKLEDNRADEFIDELFSNIHIEETHDLPLMIEQLLKEFQLNPHAVEIEMKAEKFDGTTYDFKRDN